MYLHGRKDKEGDEVVFQWPRSVGVCILEMAISLSRYTCIIKIVCGQEHSTFGAKQCFVASGTDCVEWFCL